LRRLACDLIEVYGRHTGQAGLARPVRRPWHLTRITGRIEFKIHYLRAISPARREHWRRAASRAAVRSNLPFTPIYSPEALT
jgi:hypothetical protein